MSEKPPTGPRPKPPSKPAGSPKPSPAGTGPSRQRPRPEPSQAYWAAVQASVDAAPPLTPEAQHVIATVIAPEYRRVVEARERGQAS